ncbi:hypothetical protein N0V93_003121 [Gnomoniopsis smithogilvyi]|uniref:WSC domain-containing protein n=1 Tax=Gnomoniopsis smithogilvyi TaxID=1191159 RepID=A0A9W8YW29_9PEZI|nr:hypothetical protein N0V93_003121 [Gnomoniopsis smithogilvyi]
MQSFTLSTRSRAIAVFAAITLLCIVSFGESFKALASSSFVGRAGHPHQPAKRNWESELSPFSGPPNDIGDRVEKAFVDDDLPKEVDSPQGNNAAEDGDDKFGIPNLPLPIPLPVPLATPLSIIASIFGGQGSSGTSIPVNPTAPGVPASIDGSGGGMFGSVLSILAGSPGAIPAPGSTEASNSPLGGLLSALSQAAPSPIITPPPTAPTGSGGGVGALAGVNVLGGVASALGGVLGGSDGTENGGDGLLGQLSSNILDPLSSIAADPAAILANPTAAINNLQSQVSAVLDGMPSAMAAGLQLASNVGGDIADALNATTNVLEDAPDVAGGVADQVGSLLNAGPALATGLPAAAMAAVDQVGSILNGIPGIGATVTGLLDGMKDDLSNAAANAAPQISAMAAVVGSQVAGALPTGLQPLVAAAVASQQTAAPAAPTQAGQLGPLLSMLSSSIATAAQASTNSAAVDSVANSALSGLSSLISQISQLSLTAATTPASVAASTTSSSNVAQTTIYYVQTITALMTSTATQISVVTSCPSAFSSYLPSAYPTLGGSGGSGWSSVPSGTGTDGSESGPCPGQGYTCSECLDGWFCPPAQTPAAHVPCGYGWPCYHCEGGFFCIPSPQTVAPAAPAHAHSTMAPSQTATPTSPSTSQGYQYVGCYQDNSDRSLRDAQLLSLTGGMTNDQCATFCQTQGFPIAGTEDGTQCFCGTLLLDSVSLGETQCNKSCSGDATNSTMCGGPWALSIWTIDGSLQQSQSQDSKMLLTSSTMLGWQDALAVDSRLDAATGVYGRPLPGLAISTLAASPASEHISSLDSVILAAGAAEVSGLAPNETARASGLIESVSMNLNTGMSNIASELPRAVPAGNIDVITESTNIPLVPGRVISSITLSTIGTSSTSFPVTAAASMHTTRLAGLDSMRSRIAARLDARDSDGAQADAADNDGSYIFSNTPEAPRGRARRHRVGLA